MPSAESFTSILSADLLEENRTLEAKLARLETFLHSMEMHPDYEYRRTIHELGGRSESVPDETWEKNDTIGENGVQTFIYTKEAFWRRRKS